MTRYHIVFSDIVIFQNPYNLPPFENLIIWQKGNNYFTGIVLLELGQEKFPGTANVKLYGIILHYIIIYYYTRF